MLALRGTRDKVARLGTEVSTFLLTWQRDAKTGEANDPTERCEGSSAILVAGESATVKRHEFFQICEQ